MKLSIGILGTGALGTLMAWHWREHNLFIRQRIRQDTPAPLSIQVDKQYQLSVSTWHKQPLDWLVITTKAADTLTALEDAKHSLTHVKRIMLLQNGMGQHDDAAQWLTATWPLINSSTPQPELWAGTSTEGAYRHPDGYVVYAGQGQTFAGLWADSNPLQSDDQPPPILPTGVLHDPDITTRLKAKLAINAIINPLTGYYRCKNGELLHQPEYLQHFKKLADEIANLFKALRWPVGFDIPQQATRVAEATANNQSSTFQDILNHRPTELPYITGYLLQQAKTHNLELPITQALHQSLCCAPGSSTVSPAPLAQAPIL